MTFQDRTTILTDCYNPQRDVHRLKITTADKKVVIDNDPRKTVASLNLQNGDELHWKDLGPQICECLHDYAFFEPVADFRLRLVH